MNSKCSKSAHHARKEVLTITAQKKQESNTKALRIVETLLEENVTVEWLLENVKYIDQSHLQDAIEERAIAKSCGYPICSKPLGQMPQQRFHISTKTNKVYDITERKYFCSNYCYKSAQYLKGQLLTSPVWLRDNEIIPDFHLLPCYSPGEHLGEEVVLGHDPLKLEGREKNTSKTDKTETSVSNSETFVQFQHQMVETKDETTSVVKAETLLKHEIQDLNDINTTATNSPSIQPQNKEIETNNETKSVVIVEKSSTVNIQEDSDLKKTNLVEVKKTEDSISDNKSIKTESDDKVLSNNETKKSQKQLKCSRRSKKDSKQTGNQVNFVSRIEASLKAWFTLDSFLYIYGNEKAKELMKDKKECLKEYYKGVEQTLWEPATQAKYMALCKKLNLMELEEESFENSKRESKPLPNFDQLKRDAEIMEIKVSEFYTGKTVDNVKSKSTSENEGDNNCGIPLVDLHAQNALRRRIVLDRLRYVLPDLLRTFGMTSRDISGEVRCLVTTFALEADNIMFKPPEWNLIGLIIIKLLSMKDPKLKTLMETQMAQKYTSMMLMGFQLDGGYLERLITWLADIDMLLGKTYFNL